MNKIIMHFGIRGQKWGVRKYQNPDGSLTPRGAARQQAKDEKWVEKKGEKIKEKTQNAVRKDIQKFVKNELNPQYKSNGKLSSESVLKYNNKLAELMNKKMGNVPVPSGKVMRFVAKRGEIGVHTAIADAGYDLGRLSKGVFSSGKVGYKNENLMDKGG